MFIMFVCCSVELKFSYRAAHVLLLVPLALLRISSCAGLRSGATLLMVVLQLCELYVRGVDGRMHTIVVPSSEPKVCFVTM